MEETTNSNPQEESVTTEKLKDPWAMPEFTNTVVLADGTTLQGHATLYDAAEELWVSLDGPISFDEAFTIFNDPEKTKEITSNTSILTTEKFYGYTRLTLIKQDGRKLTLRMKPGK